MRWLGEAELVTEGELSPFDTSFKLNEIPFSALNYRNPRDVFKGQEANDTLRAD